MAPGDVSIGVDYTPETYAKVWDTEFNKPRNLYLLVKDPSGHLLYPPFVLRRVNGGEGGLVIGGPGILWSEGQGGAGPAVANREYLSGADKLSNGDFGLGDLYWRRAGEGSGWEVDVGLATNVVGSDQDDVLESDEKFPARSGSHYRAEATGVSGLGRLKIRIVYEGRFNPPELWTNGDLSGGSAGWTPGTYADVVYDPANAYGGQDYVIRCLPIPKPQLILDPGMESGTGWTDESVNAGDVAIVLDPTNAYQGSRVVRVGPVTQHQVFMNADFGSGLDYWYSSSTDAEPHLGIFALDSGAGVDGNASVITSGWSTGGRTGPELIKYLRADKVLGGGVTAYDVVPGETYRAEGYLKGAPGSDGSAYLSIMIPHPSVPAGDLWIKSEELFAPPHDDNRWTIVVIDSITIPNNRSLVNALFEVHNHSLGYWSLDHFTLTRTRGNRARMVCDTAYGVETDARYEVAAFVRSAGDNQVGTVRVGVILQGPGMADQTEAEDKGSTDFVWDRVAREVRPPTGYTTLRPFVAGQDIIGAPIWLDYFTVTKLDNNRDSVGATFAAVTPERSYDIRAKVRSGIGLQRGDVRLSVRMTRPGYPDLVEDSPTVDNTGNTWKGLSFSVTPPSGYDRVYPKVVFTDVEGGNFYASHFSMVDSDTGTVVFDAALDSPVADIAILDSVAPAGTELVRLAVVAEQGSSYWSIRGARLTRTDGVPATGADIVADLLTDPDTGQPMSIGVGAVAAPATIPYDWRQVHLTEREALDHLCDVVYPGGLEYRVNASTTPTLDVAAAESLFVDHVPGGPEPVVLLGGMIRDPDVADVNPPETDTSERATEIVVVGAERQLVSGGTMLVTASAPVPGPTEFDLNNRPVVRRKYVSAGTVDHFGYAQALAADTAAREAEPALSVSVVLNEIDAGTAATLGIPPRPAFDVGDWIYVEGAGLRDLAHPITIAGTEFFPRRVRALERERSLLSGIVELLYPTGETEVLEGVAWSRTSETRLTVGDRLLDWQVDPQGRAEGVQYLEDRRSKPR
jgi:hypothetical protein